MESEAGAFSFTRCSPRNWRSWRDKSKTGFPRPGGIALAPRGEDAGGHRLLHRRSIPRDPNSPEFRQGNTLDPAIAIGSGRSFTAGTTFYRFSNEQKAIVYAWANDEKSLRKAGSRLTLIPCFRPCWIAATRPIFCRSLTKIEGMER